MLVHESYQFMMKHVKQQANGIVSVSGLSEEEAKKEEERQKEIRRQRKEEEK